MNLASRPSGRQGSPPQGRPFPRPGRPAGHGLDPTVTLYNGYGGQLDYNDDGGGGLDSQLVETLTPGTYYVEVSGWSSSTGAFTLTVR